MGQWLHEARMAAARRAGKRYWRWLLAAHLIRLAAPGLLTLTAVSIAGFLVWQTAADNVAWLHDTLHTIVGLHLSGLLRWAALGAGLVWVGWLAHDITTGAGIRRRTTGTRHPLPAYALGTALALLTASLFTR